VRQRARLTDNTEADGHCGRAEAVGGVARVPAGVALLYVGDVQPGAAALLVEPLPALVDGVRVLGPGHQRPRTAVDRTGEAHGRAELGDQRRRVLLFHLRRLRSCTDYTIHPAMQQLVGTRREGAADPQLIFTARRYASAELVVVVSVRPSVTCRYCIKTAKRRITETT